MKGNKNFEIFALKSLVMIFFYLLVAQFEINELRHEGEKYMKFDLAS